MKKLRCNCNWTKKSVIDPTLPTTLGLRYTTTDRCKLTTDKVVATCSPLYKLTFFPTDHQINLPQTRVITVLEERAW